MQQGGATSRQWKAAEKTRMPRLVLCEPTELYNILNQVTKLSRLIEPNYLCLLDVRSKREYDESHVITALHVKKELDAFQPYPIEIVPGKVFLGNFSQACDPKIQKDLKIKAHINVSMETGPFFAGEADKLLHIQIEDSPEAQILPFLRHLCHFTEVLGLCQEVQKQHVSKLGAGDSAAGMGEDYPWRFHHKHHGSTLLISTAPVRGASLGGFLWLEGQSVYTQACLEEGLCHLKVSCQPPVLIFPSACSRHTAGAPCSGSLRIRIPGASWAIPPAPLWLPLEEHLAARAAAPHPPVTWTLWGLPGGTQRLPVLVPRGYHNTHQWAEIPYPEIPSPALSRPQAPGMGSHPCLIPSASCHLPFETHFLSLLPTHFCLAEFTKERFAPSHLQLSRNS
ncbi:serine/threonine/tyrosine-interacting-like protein 1 isoform X6 [Cebus imitator]|uniref:serine/threonine/tyrosine-interacting-like protein 1 isoform X6 n=2 Tax=Cebus imitator TaxID=2715852 RepID=UPI000809EF6B|nr:serine/threonine/tyrosine-interacting-like protein 1 isoform X6 [Cebus imitator]